MERSDDASSSAVTESSPSQRVTCAGDGEDVAPGAPLQLTCQQGPISCCSDSQGAGLGLSDDVTLTDGRSQESASSDGVASCTEGSEVNLRGGGATGPHLPQSNAAQVDVTPPPDSDSDTQVSSDDDAFTASPPPPGKPRLPAARNTFTCGRRQSAPGHLQDDELQSRRPDIAEYFNRKQRSVSQSVPGWKLFGKVPPRQSPSKQARTIQQEFEARQVASRSSPTHPAAGQQSRKRAEFEPLSTTALILEDRPPNLPAKSAEEAERHRQQYEQMVAAAKRRELKEAQRRRQQQEERCRQEEVICSAAHVWSRDILPQWDAMRTSRRAQDLWWAGLPPSVRGRVWSLAIGNELNITEELYRIFLCRAKEKRSRTPTDGGDMEDGLDLITRDVSRTLPALCVFQKGGPYHDQLQSILGAYSCYRPDVGYVQGMSSMAAMLILNMEEVEVFISFSNLINRPCQLAFHRVQHQQMLRYFGAFQVFFEESLPRLFCHFQSSGVTPDLYLMDWILSLYMKPLPLDVASRVWDVFLRDGEEFLFRTALGILRLYQDVLLHMDLISIAQFLSRLPDEELLSDRLFSCISATPLLSRNRKWTQVLSSCKDSDTNS